MLHTCGLVRPAGMLGPQHQGAGDRLPGALFELVGPSPAGPPSEPGADGPGAVGSGRPARPGRTRPSPAGGKAHVHSTRV